MPCCGWPGWHDIAVLVTDVSLQCIVRGHGCATLSYPGNKGSLPRLVSRLHVCLSVGPRLPGG
jgi:hypothetical protein